MQIALLMAVLNNVDIWVADDLNAYITAPCPEKTWTTLAKEFGDDCGKKAIVESSSAASWAHLAVGRMHVRDGLRVVPR